MAGSDMSLRKAVEQRDVDLVYSLLVRDYNVNAVDKDKNTPLHIALKQRPLKFWGLIPETPEEKLASVKIALALIDHDANVKAINNQKQTPLHVLAQNCNLEVKVATALLNKEADLNAIDANGHTPLSTAIIYGNSDLAIFLIQSKAFLNTELPGNDNLLHLAARYRLPKVIESLIYAKGGLIFAINSINDKGNTPLHEAWEVYSSGIRSQGPSISKSTEITWILLRNGANVRKYNKAGLTAKNIADKWEKNAPIWKNAKKEYQSECTLIIIAILFTYVVYRIVF